MVNKDTDILVISTSCLEVPPKEYGGLELMVYNLCKELGSRGYEVTCAAPKGTEIDNVSVIETIEPDDSQDCFKKEPEAYREYKDRLDDFDIILDHSWQKISYLHKAEFHDLMKDTEILGIWHGMPSVKEKPPVENPNYISVSKAASQAWSSHTKLGVRHCYNGIDMERYPLRDSHCEKGDYYLTVNRIMKEKGIDIFCDLCEDMGVNYIVCGEDQFVDDPAYVHDIMKRCAESELGEYRGTVSHSEKVELMRNAKATILLPTRGYKEVFGLSAVESAACGTPPIVLNNNGLGEIVSEMNDILVCDELRLIKSRIKDIEERRTLNLSPEDLRERAELFSKENMADIYLKRIDEALENPW